MRWTKHPYARTSCACPPTPLNHRSGQGVSSGRDGRVGGMVEMARSQCMSSTSYLCVGVDWIGASVEWCRRQCYACYTVFEPSRSMSRLYLKCTWLASVRVDITCERGAITHGSGSNQGWARGARRRGRLSRSCGDVCRGSNPTTVTSRDRRRSLIVRALL